MRKAQSQAQFLALRLRTVADADELELALKAFRNTVRHIGDDRTHRASNCSREARARARSKLQQVLFLRQLYFRVQFDRQLALATFQREKVSALFELDAFWQLNRFFCDS